jgi:hypothetical protein
VRLASFIELKREARQNADRNVCQEQPVLWATAEASVIGLHLG